MNFNTEQTCLEILRDDILCCDYLSYTRFAGRSDLPGIPLVSPSGIHSAWVNIEKFPHRGWFDVVISGIPEFTFLGIGDVAILVLDDDSQIRLPFTRPAMGMVVRSNSANIKEDLLPTLVGRKIVRIVLARIKTGEQRVFLFPDGSDILFRWMAFHIWEEAKARGW